MNPFVLTGAAVGLLGSLHCVGMCGPLLLALPGTAAARATLFKQRSVYHIGRSLTYASLGALLGTAGGIGQLAGWQGPLSIATGIFVLLMLLVPKLLAGRLGSWSVSKWFVSIFGRLWGRIVQSQRLPDQFLLGALNGLLPCGLTAVALAASFTTGSPLDGAAYMLLFGLGTTPILLGLSLFGHAVSTPVRHKFNRLLPWGTALIGILLVLRGLSLGIPFISPNLESPKTPATPESVLTEPVGSCCK